MIKKEFKDGGFEAVVFNNKRDAADAHRGDCETGSTLAVAWCDIYGDGETELLEVNITPVIDGLVSVTTGDLFTTCYNAIMEGTSTITHGSDHADAHHVADDIVTKLTCAENETENITPEQALENLRVAIQDAEQFGLVRTENGQVITGAVKSENGIVLTEDVTPQHPSIYKRLIILK